MKQLVQLLTWSLLAAGMIVEISDLPQRKFACCTVRFLANVTGLVGLVEAEGEVLVDT